MADISTAVSMARVPILGEDGRISDDYIPAAIGENVTKAESAATRAETAAAGAEGSASAASQSAAQASGSASAASASASQAQQSATTAGGAATSAQSAQTAAEAAKTAAAGSAQDAKQSATAAQQSAASVADKFITSAQATTLEPGSQATASVDNQVLTIGVPKGDKGDQGEKGDTGTGVPEGGTPGQLLSKTDSGTAWVDPPSGNVLTGTTPEAYVAHAEDAYAQKPIEVRIKGRTVKNLWPVLSSTYNGITVTTDETGLVTVTGTSTDTTYIFARVNSAVVNKQYTLVINSAQSNFTVYFEVKKPSGDTAINASTSGSTITVASDMIVCNAGVKVPNGTTVNASFRVMLVEGTEAPDCFVPTGLHSVEPTKLVTAGKNIAVETNFTLNPSDVRTQLVSNELPPGKYYVKCSESTNSADLRLSLVGSSGKSEGYLNGNPRRGAAINVPRPGLMLQCYMPQNAEDTTNYSISNFQLELGSTATAYEPPNVATTPLPEVELRGLLNGTCDELVIAQDGTATVERRTQLSGDDVTALPEPTTEKLSAVSLPKLPAQTFNAYHDSNVPSDTTVTYERDINIAFEQLAKLIAGTASAVAVREASTIEEE